MKFSLKCCTRISGMLPSEILPYTHGSKITGQEKKENVEGGQKKDPTRVVGRIIPKLRESLIGGRSQVPTNLCYANERGIDGMEDLDIPISEIAPKIIPTFKKHAKQYIDELRPYQIENPGWFKEIRGSMHGETIIQYDFTTDEKLAKWSIGCDSDWSEGYSKCELLRSDMNTAIFQGNLNTRVVKDGRTQRAGWCGIKTNDKMAFNVKKRFEDWIYFSHLIIKLRGDGRSYKVMLHVPEWGDVTWGDSFSYPLHTHGGPYWQYAKIPFSRFFFTVNGRIQDRQVPVLKHRICSIGITLMDRIDGDFKLEIGFVGVYNDISHLEKFAYEQYQLPILSPMGC